MTRGELKEQSRMWSSTEIPLSISMYNPDIEQYCQQAYLAGAEPREKRIEELEKEGTHLFLEGAKRVEELENQNKLLGERCNQLLKDKVI